MPTASEHPPAAPELTLTEFLLARIAEDEAVAQDAVDVGWVTFRQADGSLSHTALGTPTEEGWLVDGRLVQDERAEVFYEPGRVLAECAAKRRIVEALSAPFMLVEPGAVEVARIAKKVVLNHLATVYADHPDYYEEWAL